MTQAAPVSASPITWIHLAALLTLAVLTRSYLLATLWRWYVVPQFGVAPLRMVFAFGLALMANAILSLDHNKPKDKPGDLWENFGRTFLGSLLVLLIGWIGTLFI